MKMSRPIALFFTCIMVYNILSSFSDNLSKGEDETDKPEKNADNPRQPVKLTMKQGLLMNQVVSTYVLSDVENELCNDHYREYKIGLRAFEPWALKMFDSSSKLQSGILYGNLVEFGGFDQCLKIYYESEFGPIRGKSCTFRVKPDEKLMRIISGFNNVSERRFDKIKESVIENSQLMFTVCVPDSCMAKDILPYYNKTITELTQGIAVKVSLEEEYCTSATDKLHIKNYEYIIIFIPIAIMLTVVLTTLIDFFASENIRSNWMISTFSGRANFKRMLNTRSQSGELDCLHGIRFLSVCYVVIGHRFMASMIYPSVNSFYLIEWIMEYPSTIIIGGTVCVDTFLMISGLLVTYTFFDYMDKYRKFNLLFFYIYRYVRITLPVAMAVIWHAYYLQFLGAGPLWYDGLKSQSINCHLSWWGSLLHLQSYVNPKEMCIVQTWYLTVDMVMFYLSPLIVYPLWKWPTFGYLNFILFYLASIASSFYVAWKRQFIGGMPLTATLLKTEYFQNHYITPHTRGTTYILGLGFGYILHLTKNERVFMSKPTVVIGWFLCSVMLIVPVVGSHVFQDEAHPYNRFESSIFLSCSRSAWCFGVGWLIWACVNGYGGPVNTILAANAFKILSRTSYGIFLFHLTIQMLLGSAQRHPYYFTNFQMMYQSFSDLVLMILFGFIFALFFELPFIKLQSVFMSKSKVAQKPDIPKKYNKY